MSIESDVNRISLCIYMHGGSQPIRGPPYITILSASKNGRGALATTPVRGRENKLHIATGSRRR